MGKKLTSTKAKKILEDETVRGKALTEKQKKFFGAVVGGATPLKKLNGGWLDKFDNGGVQPNYNDSNVSLPPGFKGWGYDKGGRAYNGAWDGPVTRMGGTIPGATGMMYARTSELEPLEAQYGREIVRDNTSVRMPRIPSKADLKELAYRAEQERLSRIPMLSQDNRTPEQRKQANEYADKVNNASLSLLERPLVYLANPLKLLGDVLDPFVENTPTLTKNPFPTSKQDAIESAQITYRPNTSLSDRLTEKFNMGVDYVPEAALNTALGLATAPRMTVGSVANEIVNPVAGLENAVVDPSNLVGVGLADDALKLGLKNIPLFAPFKNALKANPDMYYRGIGQAGLDDALQSGLLRAKPADQIAPAMVGPVDMAKRFNNLYVTPRLGVAQSYGKGVVAEVPRDAAIFSKRYKGSDWSMMTNNQIPIEQVNFYKKNFFGNYKPIDIPSSSLSDMPWTKPNIYPTSSPLPKNMEPYLSRKVYPFNKEQEIFESFLPIEAQLKNIDEKSIYFNEKGLQKINNSKGNNIEYIYKNIEGDEVAKFTGVKKGDVIDVTGINVSEPYRRQGIGQSIYENVAKETPLTSRSTQQQFTLKDDVGRSISPSNKLWEKLVKEGKAEKIKQQYDWLYKTKFQDGGVIEDDRGQWAHPGKITKINSNNITMKGVNYPVLGISNTGDEQLMMPGEDYKFDGDSVTEYPMAQNGETIIVNSKNDPRYQRYQDSLDIYNSNEKLLKNLEKAGYKQTSDNGIIGKSPKEALKLYRNIAENKTRIGQYPNLKQADPRKKDRLYEVNDLHPMILNETLGTQLFHPDILPDGYQSWHEKSTLGVGHGDKRVTFNYSNVKPKQEVIVEEPNQKLNKAITPKPYIQPRNIGQPLNLNSQGLNVSEQTPTSSLEKIPQRAIRNWDVEQSVNQNFGSNTKKFKATSRKELEALKRKQAIDEKTKTGNKNTLKIIPNYYQGGGTVKAQNGKQLQKLDQLTNFTNYNTQQPGGWLDKYH